jgi:hypothetical protein
VNLDQTLLQRAKRLALQEGRSLSDLLNGALAAYLSRGRDPAREGTRDGTKDAEPEPLSGRRSYARLREPGAADEDEEVTSLAIPKTRKPTAR